MTKFGVESKKGKKYTMKINTKSVVEVIVPKEKALELSRLLVCSNNNSWSDAWKRHKIEVFVVGFVNEKDERIFQTECYSANNLPTDIIKEFLVQVFSLEETTNVEILQRFAEDNFKNI